MNFQKRSRKPASDSNLNPQATQPENPLDAQILLLSGYQDGQGQGLKCGFALALIRILSGVVCPGPFLDQDFTAQYSFGKCRHKSTKRIRSRQTHFRSLRPQNAGNLAPKQTLSKIESSSFVTTEEDQL
ncbi:unnamed protein product [Amoebophrya sp. A120]|nr:unnamed protein product [Amoebophrya sp. A120]|eukprot:GSA120T00021837001.1